MATLREDIKTQSDWIVQAFAADNFRLDYTLDSFIEIDRFFVSNMKNGRPKKGGRLAKKGFGPILFSIGAYIGETIIKIVPGSEWITDDNDPQGELTVALRLPNGMEIWPIQRVMKRFKNGSEDSIYPYGHTITKKFINQPFNQLFWKVTAEDSEAEVTKPWWRFW